MQKDFLKGFTKADLFAETIPMNLVYAVSFEGSVNTFGIDADRLEYYKQQYPTDELMAVRAGVAEAYDMEIDDVYPGRGFSYVGEPQMEERLYQARRMWGLRSFNWMLKVELTQGQC